MDTPALEVRFRARITIDYPNVIARGAAARLGALIRRWVPPERPLVVVSDGTVADLHWPAIDRALRVAGRVAALVTMPPGERSKSPETVDRLIDELLSIGTHRRSVIVALGGGVVCDTVGFIAATYMRGLDYLNVPTSLIAQLDAAIGGKVAVNHPRAKNFVGAFHHPLAVIVDPDLLDTLPRDETRNGLAEAVKMGIIHSPALFALVEAEGTRLLDPVAAGAALDAVIAEAVRGKIALLEPDPFERDLRRVLNFGHTFAHPLEVAEGFALRHGYAVAIGMCIAARVARARGLVEPGVVPRLVALLERLGLPTDGPPLDPRRIWESAHIVRKIRADHLHYVLPTGIGTTCIIDDLRRDEFLAAYRAPVTRPIGRHVEMPAVG